MGDFAMVKELNKYFHVLVKFKFVFYLNFYLKISGMKIKMC